MTTSVVITLQVEGVHSWEGCNIPSVHFLAFSHRHIFHIKCKKTVSHDDRDIEIICFKREVTAYLTKKYGDGQNVCHFANMSCEMIAKELMKEFNLDFCSVLEDGENGAEVTKN